MSEPIETEISNEARQVREDCADAICETIASLMKAHFVTYKPTNSRDTLIGWIETCQNTATKELREQNASLRHELERLRDLVGAEDVASINAVLGECADGERCCVRCGERLKGVMALTATLCGLCADDERNGR